MRARNIKPGLFKNERLADADHATRMLFIGLWMMADREGRLEDRPRRIKAEIMPYDDAPDITRALATLEQLGFIARYSVGDVAVIEVVNFTKHQNPHRNEKASELPKRPEGRIDAGSGEDSSNGTTRSVHVEERGEALRLNPDTGSLNPDTGLRTADSLNNNAHEARTDVVVDRAELSTVAQAANEQPCAGVRRLREAHAPADIHAVPDDIGAYRRRLEGRFGYTERQSGAGDSIVASRSLKAGGCTLADLDAAVQRAGEQGQHEKPLAYLLKIVNSQRAEREADTVPMRSPTQSPGSLGDRLAAMYEQPEADDADIVATQHVPRLGAAS